MTEIFCGLVICGSWTWNCMPGNGIPLDIDVYAMALWSSIVPLSECSVANGSNSAEVPDFIQERGKQTSEQWI